MSKFDLFNLNVEKDESKVEPYIKMLENKNNPWWVRCRAAETLGQIGDVRAVEPLIKVIEDKNDDACREAVEALGNIGDARSVEPLIKALGDRDGNIVNHWEVRCRAAETLGQIGDARSVEPLIKALGDRDGKIVYAAAVALGKMRDARAVEPLIEALGGRDRFGEVEEALIKIGEPALEYLINALANDNVWVRRNAAEILGKMGDARAVEPLIEALGDKDLWMRHRAAESLKKITSYLNPIKARVSTVFCSECFCRFKRHKAKISFFKSITYYACHRCHSTVHLIENVEKPIVVLDHSFKKPYIHNSTTLSVNWFKHKEPFDFDEIHIKDADDFEVEEMIIKLWNDTDANRRKRYRSMPVYIASNLKLAQATMNMLEDTFGQIKIRD